MFKRSGSFVLTKMGSLALRQNGRHDSILPYGFNLFC